MSKDLNAKILENIVVEQKEWKPQVSTLHAFVVEEQSIFS